MKKLLTMLAIVSMTTTSTTTLVACANNNIIDDDNYNNGKYEYELFNKRFTSKSDAISYYLENEVQINEQYEYENDILLNNDHYNNLTNLYSDVTNDANINSLKTNKDTSKYTLDSLGQLSSDVVTNPNNLVDVYQSSNGQAVDSLKEAQESYTNKIQKKYEADSQYFNNLTEIQEYYHNKYEINENLNLQKTDNYRLGNLWYSKSGFDKKIDESITSAVEYNGIQITSENRYNLSRINLKNEDEAKIEKRVEQPGSYFVQMRPGADGTLIGSNFLKSTEALNTSIINKDNWQQTKQTSSSALDLITGWTISIATFGIFSEYGSSIDVKNSYSIEHAWDFEPVFNYYSSDELNASFLAILNKYQLKNQAINFWNGMKSFSDLSLAKKIEIELFKIREILRNVDVSSDDNKFIKEYYYKILLSLNTITSNTMPYNIKNNLNERWKNTVDEFYKTDIMILLDYLMDSSDLTKISNPQKKLLENYNYMVMQSTDSLTKYMTESANQVEKYLAIALPIIKNIVKALLKQIPQLKVISQLLDSIPVQTTTTYEFVVPDTGKKLTYQNTKWFWELNDFNPAADISCLEIAKPQTTTLYLYDDKYFSSLVEAEDRLKLDILTKLFSDPNSVKYTSKYFATIIENNKEDLIKKINEVVDIKQGYLDEFGNSFDSAQEALNNILSHLKLGDYKVVYTYDFNNQKYTGDTYEEVENLVLNSIKINTKKADFSQLLKQKDFSKIDDLNNEGYTIYSLEYNDKTYYFDSKMGAMIYYLKLNNYSNVLVKIDLSTYTLNNQTFDSKDKYIDYLYLNIQEVEIS